MEPGENDREALVRELFEELSIEADIGGLLGETTHAYRDLTIHLVAYLAATRDSPIPSEHAEVRWASPDELSELAWADADRALVPALIHCLVS